MRPRLLHLGYFNLEVNKNQILRRFNEAEAFTPRIHRCAGTTIPICSSFNEAEAFTPRIQRKPKKSETACLQLQ